MDVQVQIRKAVYKETGAVLKNYCLCASSENPKYVMFDVSREDFEKLYKVNSIVTQDYVVEKKGRTVEVDEDTVEIKIYYSRRDDKDYSNKLGTGEKQYGAIAPDGKFYECGYSGHNDLEYRLKELGILTDRNNAFEWYGWVKLTGSYMTECEFAFNEEIDDYDFGTRERTVVKKNTLTKEQINSMIAYIESLGREYINFNYNWHTLKDFKKIGKYKGKLVDFIINTKYVNLKDGMEELNKTKSNE